MPALGARSPIGIQMLDYSGEVKGIPSLYGIPVNATTYDDAETDLGVLVSAIEGITLGNVSRTSISTTEQVTNTFPTDKNAQIETELLVSMRDNVTQQPWSFRIPTADYEAHNYAGYPNGDAVIIAGAGATAATLAAVAAFNAHLRSPFDNANASVVVGMRIVK